MFYVLFFSFFYNNINGSLNTVNYVNWRQHSKEKGEAMSVVDAIIVQKTMGGLNHAR